MRLVPGLEIGDIKVYIQVPDRAEIVEEPIEGLSGQLQGELEEKLTNRMRMVGEAISGVCATIYSSVEKTIDTVRPDEITLEFGIKLGGKTGVPFVTEGSAEGSFKVSATWKGVSRSKDIVSEEKETASEEDDDDEAKKET